MFGLMCIVCLTNRSNLSFLLGGNNDDDDGKVNLIYLIEYATTNTCSEI